MRAPLLVLLALAATSAGARDLAGSVTKVIDGDTFALTVPATKPHKPVVHTIRLTAIDAPEAGQASFDKARDDLARVLAGKSITVLDVRKDRGDRSIGRVQLDGVDVGLAQIKAGLAWYARRDAAALSLEQQGYYLTAEGAARRDRAGLWSDANPVPPWNFGRAAKRKQ